MEKQNEDRPNIVQVLSQPAPVDPPEESQEPVDSKDEDLPPLKPEKEVVEKVVYREPRGGFLNTGCGCRTITCGGCLIILALIVGFAYVLIKKPVQVWTPFVDFLNADLVLPVYETITPEGAQIEIENQIEGIGNNEIYITERQFTAFARSNLTFFDNLVVDIESGFVRIYWILDETVNGNPLWGIVELRKEDGKIFIETIGTRRVGLPKIFNDLITNLLLSALNIGAEEVDNNKLIQQMLNINEDFNIQDIEFEKDRIKMNVLFDSTFFN